MASGKRDRDRTEAKILAAVGRLIATKGVESLGVNAVAGAAGVDKVLLYRYFGDLDGLLRRYGASIDFWPSLDEVLGPDRKVLRARAPGAIASRIVINFARALRRRPMTLQLMAWECAHHNELTVALEDARERWSEALLAEVRGAGIPYPPELSVIGVLLAAAVGYLALRGRETKVYGGLEIGSDRGWRVIESALEGFLGGAPPSRAPRAPPSRAPRAPPSRAARAPPSRAPRAPPSRAPRAPPSRAPRAPRRRPPT
jgi:AcrR family transcriptional regulator